jgi:glycine hydroxymethyltransferase
MHSKDKLGEVLDTDPEVYNIIQSEEQRQADCIRLIASENYASKAVMQATGSVFTNKYSEGYAGKRYYQGQQWTDKVETLACDRAKRLFGAEHVNIQPYSGSPANLAVYYALAELGDPILGMSLPFGGHLTHGWKVNFSGRFYKAHHYTLNKETELIDFDEVRRIAKEVKPKLIICGGSAYPRIIDFHKFAEIANEVGAKLIADIAHISGLVASGVHPSPIHVADVVTTTTHKTLRGPRGGMIMCKKEYANQIDRAVFPALQGGPHMNQVAAAAVAFHEALQPDFQAYAQKVVNNAKAMAEAFNSKGYRLVTGGTDNHLLLLDLTPQKVGGNTVARALEVAGIVCNSNAVPYDTRGPLDPSGIRLGTAAMTTRGMKEVEMFQIVEWIDEVIKNLDNEQKIDKVRQDVLELCREYPVP